MIGSAIGLKLSGIENSLDGNVTFMAVPAEECIEVAYRQELRKEGKIWKAAHAAEAPEEGVNALNAAMLGIMGINALRETFRDDDCIRVHPIITKGGDVVNSVPEDKILDAGHFNASTDMGDVSHLIPTIHPYIGGVSGFLHAKEVTQKARVEKILTLAFFIL